MRADYADTFLTQKCRVLKSETQNIDGRGETSYPATGAIIPCRISVSSGQREGVEGEQVQAIAQTVIEVPIGTKISAADRVAVANNAYVGFLRDGSLYGATVWSVSGPSDAGHADAMVLTMPVVRVGK